MNNKLIGMTVGAGAMLAVLVAGSNAYALSIVGGGMGGMQMNSGSVESMGGMGGMDMQATSSASATETGSIGATATLGLSAQVQLGQIVTSSATGTEIVNLEGNTNSLIQTNADLDAYNNMVIQARPAIKSVNVANDGSVVVAYSQPARFLGIFPTSISGNVEVDAQGNTTVHLPWWSMFYAKDTTGVQSSVASSVQQSGVDFSGAAQANAETAAENSARLVNAVTSAIQTQTSVSASTSANAAVQ